MSNKNKLVILRGVPGSGKSTRAQEVMEEEGYGFKTIVSADCYFIRPDGKYDWCASSLGNAHKWCQKQAEDAMRGHEIWAHRTIVIVDNTNIKRKDFKVYTQLAEKYGFEVEEVVVGNFDEESVKLYAERNSHGVPLATIQRMAERFEK